MIRLDPATASPAALPAVPVWAQVASDAPSDADAALGVLDVLARTQTSWAGA